jgi:hypothetical protein
MKYPLTPKSTSYIEPGQIWAIPLSNGKYACGVVLAKLKSKEGIEKRAFYAALLNWCDKAPPNTENVRASGFLEKGALHVKSISNIGSEIIGKADFEDLPPNPSEYTHEIVTMGYNVFSAVAEKHFVE